MPRRKSLSVSIGICAYNEEQNIGGLLSALLKQRAKTVLIKEIIVVSSACTDNTDWIVKEYSKKYKRVKLVTQKVRKGKVSAMSLFIKKAKSNILVFENADTLPKEDAIELLVKPFFDKEIGMTGGRQEDFYGIYCSSLMGYTPPAGSKRAEVNRAGSFQKDIQGDSYEG